MATNPSPEKDAQVGVRKENTIVTNHIYVISSESGSVKIGIATDPEFRLKALQTASPSSLSLKYSFKCSDPLDVPKMEAAVHKLLCGRRQRGEWFDISVHEAFNAVVSVANQFGYAVSQFEVSQFEADRPSAIDALLEALREDFLEPPFPTLNPAVASKVIAVLAAELDRRRLRSQQQLVLLW